MPGPFTPNAGFIVPNTGDLVDTWGEDAVNPDYVAIDGMLCGVQSISLSNVPVTLTSETGFTATPSAGPSQSQNRVLRFTGALSADVTVTLPSPASYIVENLTTGAFDVILRGAVATTEVIAIPQGESVEIYNDGSRVRFTGLGRMGHMEHWVGLSAMPAWVGKCTVKPYLLCDDVIYNVSDYPYLGARLLGKFGGNGITTFANPDMRGRVPLAYDGTGTRITVAGSGINGQTIGATNPGGLGQTQTLVAANLPPYTPAGTIANGSISINGGQFYAYTQTSGGGGVGGGGVFGISGVNVLTASQGASTFTGTAQGGTSQPFGVVQPSLVTGIWVMKT